MSGTGARAEPGRGASGIAASRGNGGASAAVGGAVPQALPPRLSSSVPTCEDPGYPWLYSAVDMLTQCVMFTVLIVSFGSDILPRHMPAHKPLFSPEAKGPAASARAREEQRLQELLKSPEMAKSVKLIKEGGNVTLLLGDAIFFDSGKAMVKPSAVEILGRVADVLAEGRSEIWVEGYTDEVPIRSALFPSNWELSAARAIAVLRELVDHGVKPGRVAAAGYGEYRPRYPNNSAANRAANRRVEILLVFGS